MFLEMQLPRPWQSDSEQVLFRNALEWVEIGDRIGIHCVWAQEHHFLEEYSHSTAPEVLLAACAARTKRIRIGHAVMVMPPKFNHPARAAERLATLDLISEGRVEWGSGESSSRIELEGFTVSYVEKRSMWAEAVRECAKMMDATPYPGFEGKYFTMPSRNVVPKPVQRPHPPLWVACTNRDTMRLAARLGVGALTFAFMDPGEAKFWIEEYYDTFRRECTPIGRAVNPNVAMLGGLMCHEDSEVARARGIEGQRFFAYGLAHYYRFGRHRPGQTDIWSEFKKSQSSPMAGLAGVGSPEEVREAFQELEKAGLDQLILLQQAGKYEHEHICASLELFGREVLPGFAARQEVQHRKKTEELGPYIERALERIPPLNQHEVPMVQSYQVLWDALGAETSSAASKRHLDAGRLWKLHIGAKARTP
jgi:alkanesulfonate monooxygenase SsuD/methylene tetrahydromethanopterin reductase-like flavin-dependent oxidoreductase (luciferase family)